jgi:hypothetical protein
VTFLGAGLAERVVELDWPSWVVDAEEKVVLGPVFADPVPSRTNLAVADDYSVVGCLRIASLVGDVVDSDLPVDGERLDDASEA